MSRPTPSPFFRNRMNGSVIADRRATHPAAKGFAVCSPQPKAESDSR